MHIQYSSGTTRHISTQKIILKNKEQQSSMKFQFRKYDHAQIFLRLRLNSMLYEKYVQCQQYNNITI